MTMQPWVTFGEIPDEMKDPLTYAVALVAWLGIVLLVVILVSEFVQAFF